MSSFSTILTGLDPGVMTITLNRPEALNAFNDEMSIELNTALRAAQRDDKVRCVVLTGAGRGFCSGQDLAEVQARYATGGDQAALDFAAHLRNKYNPIVTRLRTMEKPAIAAINGVAAGAGASFALACDLKVCGASAKIMMAFVHVGLIPDSAATQTLLQHVGYARAAELCMMGEKLSAADALAWGLVNRVVEDEQLMPAVGEMATRLAGMPTRAIGLTKRLLNNAWTATVDEQLESEAYVQETAGRTADHREGVLAFLEKRKPAFAGR